MRERGVALVVCGIAHPPPKPEEETDIGLLLKARCVLVSTLVFSISRA